MVPLELLYAFLSCSFSHLNGFFLALPFAVQLLSERLCIHLTVLLILQVVLLYILNQLMQFLELCFLVVVLLVSEMGAQRLLDVLDVFFDALAV